MKKKKSNKSVMKIYNKVFGNESFERLKKKVRKKFKSDKDVMIPNLIKVANLNIEVKNKAMIISVLFTSYEESEITKDLLGNAIDTYSVVIESKGDKTCVINKTLVFEFSGNNSKIFEEKGMDEKFEKMVKREIRDKVEYCQEFNYFPHSK